MVRLLAVILFACCPTAQLSAQASKEQEPVRQTPAAQSPKTQFPLDAFPEFSAVMVGSVVSGDDRESHIYRSGKLVRTEGLGSVIS